MSGEDHIQELAKRVPCNNIRWADHFQLQTPDKTDLIILIDNQLMTKSDTVTHIFGINFFYHMTYNKLIITKYIVLNTTFCNFGQYLIHPLNC